LPRRRSGRPTTERGDVGSAPPACNVAACKRGVVEIRDGHPKMRRVVRPDEGEEFAGGRLSQRVRRPRLRVERIRQSVKQRRETGIVFAVALDREKEAPVVGTSPNWVD
jgi:hypothetical protein